MEKYLENQFVTEEVAIRLKELGFDEFCFATIEGDSDICLVANPNKCKNSLDPTEIAVPLWQQALSWLREKGYHIAIHPIISMNKPTIYFDYTGSIYEDKTTTYNSYEEALEIAIKERLKLIKKRE